MRTHLLPLLLFLLAGLLPGHAAVNLSISGGNGTPLTVTFPETLYFSNVTTGLTTGYGIVIQDAFSGNSTNEVHFHGGTAGWGNSGGTTSGTGIFGFSNADNHLLTNLQLVWGLGDEPTTTANMKLRAGTRTSADGSATPENFLLAVPNVTDTPFSVFMIDSAGNIISDEASNVPEPSWAALALAAVAFFVVRRRRA